MFTPAETVIFQRQTQKGNLAQLASDGGKFKSNSSFTPEELRDCFTLTDTKCDTKDKLGEKWSTYTGVSSLHSQGCIDQPLLTVCEELEDTLSYVKIVDDELTINYDSASSCESSLDDVLNNEAEFAFPDNDEYDEAEESSSEEEEFDG